MAMRQEDDIGPPFPVHIRGLDVANLSDQSVDSSSHGIGTPDTCFSVMCSPMKETPVHTLRSRTHLSRCSMVVRCPGLDFVFVRESQSLQDLHNFRNPILPGPLSW